MLKLTGRLDSGKRSITQIAKLNWLSERGKTITYTKHITFEATKGKNITFHTIEIPEDLKNTPNLFILAKITKAKYRGFSLFAASSYGATIGGVKATASPKSISGWGTHLVFDYSIFPEASQWEIVNPTCNFYTSITQTVELDLEVKIWTDTFPDKITQNFSIPSTLAQSTKDLGITRETLLKYIKALADVGKSRTLTIGSTLLALLTDEDKKIATDKGWTLA